MLQQNGHRCGGGDDPLGAHAGFGQAKVQRIVAAPRELGIDGDQVLNMRDLAGKDDSIARQPERLGKLGTAQSRRDQSLAGHLRGIERILRLRIFVHQTREKVLIEAAPIDADTHRLAVVDRPFDHHRELRIVLAALPDVARVDTVFRERPSAIRKVAEQLVTVEVEVADQRYLAVERVEPLANHRHGRSGLGRVDGNAHQFRPGVGQRLGLRNRGSDIGRVGIRHRLHDNRMTAAYGDAADQRNSRAAACDRWTIERTRCLIRHALLPKYAIDESRQTMAGQNEILAPRAGSNSADQGDD